MDFVLYLKSAFVETPLEPLMLGIQKLTRLKRRMQHPELAEIYLEEKYLPMILQNVLSPTSNVVDVGCHIGLFLSLVRKYAPRGKHIAIEASPSKCLRLRKMFPSVEIKQVAISDFNGVSTFEDDLDMPGFSRLEGSDDPRLGRVNKYEVNVSTLDSVLTPGRPIALMKLDIESFELPALRGAVRTFATAAPILIVECSVNGEARRQFYEFITTDLAYSIYTFGDFLFNKGPLGFDEFTKCGQYPFRAFNYIAAARDYLR